MLTPKNTFMPVEMFKSQKTPNNINFMSLK